MTPEMKIATAGVTAVGGALLGVFQAATGVTLDSSRVLELIMVGALGLIGVLLRAAWKDLQQRDDDAKEDRRDMWSALNGVKDRIGTLETEVAVLSDRKERR